MRLVRFEHGPSRFVVIWIGQLVSAVGSSLTGFALGVWVYLETGSITQFALIAFFTTLPGILVSPLAGALVDRWDRRTAMIVSDVGAGLATLALTVLLIADRLDVWEIYVLMSVHSVFVALQWPAFASVTTTLIPKRHLARAAGLMESSPALAQMVGPIVAGALVVTVGVKWVLVLDTLTFAFALVTLALVRVPRPERSTEALEAEGSLLRETWYGWHYIRRRRGLFALTLLFAVVSFAVGFVSVLATPLVLSFEGPFILGAGLSIGGVGLLAGSLLMIVWGGPSADRMRLVLASVFLCGASVVAAGVRPWPALLAVAAFLFFFSLPLINTCTLAILQTKVAPDVQGRVFAVGKVIAWSTLPLAYLLAGPATEHLFEPLLAADGALANTVGHVVGVGPGRGIGLAFVLLGSLLVISAVVAHLQPDVRMLERRLPDYSEESAEALRDSPADALASVEGI